MSLADPTSPGTPEKLGTWEIWDKAYYDQMNAKDQIERKERLIDYLTRALDDESDEEA